ncbi:MAG: FAD-dependent oxidoreductase, partial [Endomicrobiia bacterium]
FGIKLTNTLACVNNKDVFSKNEPMMYMSGRALHPIGINLANKINTTFNGDIKISFAGGVDTFNISEVISCNLIPTTVCSDILKPGGYARLSQYLQILYSDFKKLKVNSIEQFVIKKSGLKNVDIKNAIIKNLNLYSQKVLENKSYYKETNPYKPIKIKSKELKPFDCIHAPCVTTCPTNQDVPNYLFLSKQKKFNKALELIKKDNPLPKICGTICVHPCETKCTRINYDTPVMIREIKKFIAEKGKFIPKKLVNKCTEKVAIIGAGPAGLSAAYYLSLANLDITIFDSMSNYGGTISKLIPEFRISKKTIYDDVSKILTLGVKIKYNLTFGKDFDIKKLQNDGFKYIFIATGLQKGKKLNIENEDKKNVFDCLTFLTQVKSKTIDLSSLGNEIIILGGGNSAIDAARTAKKFLKNNGSVTVVYRRTKDLMPADFKEINEMLNEGIKLIELTAPKKILTYNGVVSGLECIKMGLSEKDSSGRQKPVEIQGTEFVLPCSAIIIAIGQENDITNFNNLGLKLTKNGLIETDINLETNIKNCFAGGDVVHGATSIIQSIADGKKVAYEIISRCGIKNFQKINTTKIVKNIPLNKLFSKKFLRIKPNYSNITTKNYSLESARCLNCDLLCNICVTVCPNRANQYYETRKQTFSVKKVVVNNNKPQILYDKQFILSQQIQVLSIGDFCNECGNCNTFCPSDNAPYKIKPKIYLTKSEFDTEFNNVFYYSKNEKCLYAKFNGNLHSLVKKNKVLLYETNELKIKFSLNLVEIKNLTLKTNFPNNTIISLKPAIYMYIILNYGIKSLNFIFYS